MIQLGAPDEINHSKGLFNSPDLKPESFRLQNGEGFLSDDPDSPESQDWQINLDSDQTIHPDPATWVRVLVLNRDHLTGTGNWFYVVVFECEREHITRIFQFSSEGVSLKYLDEKALVLGLDIWTRDDAHCCPSQHNELIYQWNAQEHRYHRISR